MSDELLKEIRQDTKEMRAHLIEMIKHQAVMNQTLIEHERRSTNLESRMVPLEDSHKYLHKLSSQALILLTVVGSLLSIYKLLFK